MPNDTVVIPQGQYKGKLGDIGCVQNSQLGQLEQHGQPIMQCRADLACYKTLQLCQMPQVHWGVWGFLKKHLCLFSIELDSELDTSYSYIYIYRIRSYI